MKRLSFRSMLVLSDREQKGKEISFHKQRTILKGPNDTGKSSIIKTIYWTFGAAPHHQHPVWSAANIVSAISFTLDDVQYRILRDGDRFTLFDRSDNRLQSFSRVTSQLGPAFARLFNFPLRLAGRGDHEESQATPAFLFLPFYFDQDSSWASNWSGFSRLGQFSNWRADVVQFHCGVRPAEFYAAKSDRARALKEQTRLAEETDVIRSVRERLENDLPVAQFDTDVEVFRAEIDELLAEAAILQRDEEKLRNQIVRRHNERESVLQQIAITKAAVRELAKDFDFAAAQLEDTVLCPTCGTEHSNSFAERFYIARDEDQCSQLLIKLNTQLEELDEEIAAQSKQHGEMMVRAQRIREILQRKRGRVTLHEIVRMESKKHLKSILQSDIATLDQSSAHAEQESAKAKDRMDKLSDKRRHQEIRGFYLAKMKEFLHRLGVLNMQEKQYKTLDAKIEESGSDQPRALLAYYFAILHTIAQYSSSTFCPIVIDSPKQQDQDTENWSKMVRFIIEQQPAGSQIILGLVDEGGVPLGGSTISLGEKHSVLERAEYSRVASEIEALREKSFA